MWYDTSEDVDGCLMTLTLCFIGILVDEDDIHCSRFPAFCMCSRSQFLRTIVTSEAYQEFRDARASYGALADLLEAIEHLLNRVNTCTRISSTPAMTEIIVKIMVELFSTLAEVTKQIRQKLPSKSVLTDIPLD